MSDLRSVTQQFLEAARELDTIGGAGYAALLLGSIQVAAPSRRAVPSSAAAPKPKAQKVAGKTTTYTLNDGRGRVPNFVLSLTGAKDKKELLSMYDLGAYFELGKPLPQKKKESGALKLAPPSEAAKKIEAPAIPPEPPKAKAPTRRKKAQA